MFESLLPWNFFDSAENGSKAAFGAGTIGAGFFGAFWSWIGFEMAPNYAEESRDPKKIMGPATYISVIGLGILYTFVTWMLVVAYGKAGIIPGINAQLERRGRVGLLPGDGPRDRPRHRRRVAPHAGVRAHDRDRLVRVSARVLQHGHALLLLDGPRGRPAAAARQDASRRITARTSRARSSACFCALIIAGFLLHDSSTLGALLKLGTWVPMMGNIGILSVMALVSVAIIKYFATTAKDGQQLVVRRSLAPILATGAMFVRGRSS